MAFVFRRPSDVAYRRKHLRVLGRTLALPLGVGAVGGVGTLSTKITMHALTGVSASGAVHAASGAAFYSTNITGVHSTAATHALAKTIVQALPMGVIGHGLGNPVSPSEGPTTPTGVAASAATHAVVTDVSDFANVVGVNATGAVGIAQLGRKVPAFGVSGNGHVRTPFFPGSAWYAYANSNGAVARTAPLTAQPQVKTTGVGAVGATHFVIAGFTLPHIAGVATTRSLITKAGALVLGVGAVGAANHVPAGPSGAPIHTTGTGATGILVYKMQRTLNGAKGKAATNFAWRYGFFGLTGISAKATTHPVREYFFGNVMTVTNNPLNLEITNLPVGSTIPPINGALVLHSTSANAPIWWNGVQWVLLFGSAVVVLPGFIYQMYPTGLSGSSTTAALTVGTGVATDNTGVSLIQAVTPLSWTVANGNAANGYDGGTTLPPSSTIHVFVCSGISGVASFSSTQLAPTFPSGYNGAYRRVCSFTTDSFGNPHPYTIVQGYGGAMFVWLSTDVLDLSNVSPGTGSRTYYSMSVPVGISVQWFGRVADTASNGQFIVTGPAEPDVAPSLTTAPLFDVSNASGNAAPVVGYHPIVTNTLGQIAIRASATIIVNAATIGWLDYRAS